MKSHFLEPGILRIFRWYAILRIALVLLIPLGSMFISPMGQRPQVPQGDDPTNYPFLVIGEMLILLGYLSWPKLQQRMGKAYLPVGLLLAAAGLMLEPHIAGSYGRLWSSDPFLYLLIILVAWQYPFGWVAAFAFFTLGVDALLSPNFYSGMMINNPPPFITQGILLFGRLFSRTISFLIIGFVVNHLVREQRQQRVELQNANQRLVQYASTLEQLTISRERNRLSRELHDILAHTLSALAVQIDGVTTLWDNAPQKARDMLNKMLETTRSGLTETRRALHALRASPLEDLGLALAIKTLAEDSAAQHGYTLEIDIDEDLGSLTPEVELTFYRIAQEALGNIGQHAQASHVEVNLKRSGNLLTLAIQDNGVGFAAGQLTEEQQLGLRGMQERAELVNADLSIDSQPDKGTLVKLQKELR